MAEENSFPSLLKSFIIITLFIFVLLGIVISLAGNYDKDTTEIDEAIGLSAVNNTLFDTEATAQVWQERTAGFSEGSTFEKLLDIVGFLSVGMFNLVTDMAGFIIAPFTIFSNILINVLHFPIIVVGILNVIIILTIIFGIWSLVKRGV